MIKYTIAFLRLIRAVNLVIIALSLSLFYYLILVPVHENILHTTLLPFITRDFALFVVSVVLVAAAGNIINDYYDFELDREFKRDRPLASGKISLNTALILHVAFALGGIGIGYYLGWSYGNLSIGYLYVFCVLLLYAYSAFLKKIALAGNIVISALTAFVFVLLMVFEVKFLNTITFDNARFALTVLLSQMKFYAGFAFLTNLAREIVKDIEDREGDAEYDVNTLVVQFGPEIAKIVTGIVLLLLLAGLSYFMIGFFKANALHELAYLGIAVVVPVLITLLLLVVAKEKNDFARLSFMLKIIMLLGIISIPVFYYFT